ncbi:MAG TPA: helix-turn-helix domain-containing protein [Solirubrobacterales bacterium]|nr:helix-turn-helix domain-containing protein [Solirubrobacterales bacterium]
MSEQILPPEEPWRGIPASIGGWLEPHLPALSDEIIAAIRKSVPAYRRPLRGRFGAGIRRGVEEALGQFVDLIADPELDRSAAERVYRGLGRGEYRERRSLDALLAAYRLGARVAWRRVAELAIDARVDRRTLALLAEAVFAYIDGISALSAEGYAEEQSAQAGEAQRRRRRLARLLLDPEYDAEAVAEAARAAGWDPPARVAVIRWASGARRLRARLPFDALVVEDLEDPDGGTAILRDPEAPGLTATLERAAEGSVAVLGPAVPPVAAAASADRASALLDLAQRGAVQGRGLLRTEDHLARLVTHGEQGALEDLARRRLAPLDSETPASRARLTETLRTWLDLQGEVAAVAAELHVHPQTVRYRLGRLRDRLGGALDDPEARFELTLALRADGLRA